MEKKNNETNKILNEISEIRKNQEKIETKQILLRQGIKEIKSMLTMVMTSLNVPPPSAKLQQIQNEKEIAYTKAVEKNRPPTCSLDFPDDDEQVNTMVKYATTHNPTISALFIMYSFVLFNVPQFPNKTRLCCFFFFTRNCHFGNTK